MGLIQTLSARKQKQKIALLQKKLEKAKISEEQAKEEVVNLSLKVDEAQLALIRRQLDDYEMKKEGSSDLFIEEREALYRMIQSGSLTSQAQVELDRILEWITELSDEERRVY